MASTSKCEEKKRMLFKYFMFWEESIIYKQHGYSCYQQLVKFNHLNDFFTLN